MMVKPTVNKKIEVLREAFDKENEKMLYNTVELCRNVVRTVMNLGLAFHV